MYGVFLYDKFILQFSHFSDILIRIGIRKMLFWGIRIPKKSFLYIVLFLCIGIRIRIR